MGREGDKYSREGTFKEGEAQCLVEGAQCLVDDERVEGSWESLMVW